MFVRSAPMQISTHIVMQHARGAKHSLVAHITFANDLRSFLDDLEALHVDVTAHERLCMSLIPVSRSTQGLIRIVDPQPRGGGICTCYVTPQRVQGLGVINAADECDPWTCVIDAVNERQHEQWGVPPLASGCCAGRISRCSATPEQVSTHCPVDD
jgi:hypothetical protein